MAQSDAILDRLAGLHPKIIDLSLDRMWRILDRLGHPHLNLPPVIHVAGTNGKGSTVAFMRAMLEAAGKGVHVYTSPHLVRFHERIRLASPDGGKLVAEPVLAEALEHAETLNEGVPITIFEITTAAALHLFATHPADVLLLEVGLGGRLDATNVIDTPLASVITPVSHDHAGYLGDSLPGIAREKAGIIKPGAPCVVSRQPDEALDVILEIGVERGAPLFVSGRDWNARLENGRMIFEDSSGLIDLTAPRLPGRHQIENAGAAIATLRAAGFALHTDDIEAGLQSVQWPARMQAISQGPVVEAAPPGSEIWLDGGHNPSAGEVLAVRLAEMEEASARPLVLVCGMLTTKTATGFFAPFAGLAREVLTVEIPGEPASFTAEALAEQARIAGVPARPMPDLMSALAAIDTDEPPRILIGGSLYFAGHVLAMQDAVLA
ncbi:bifunctional folylpolyglutamate synthase/dihydrofolate synthase [Tepidamorphus sp. 3E244]|uniref:bifunctional folylpolyglutamate synthase/dihydrofolate synthase n=1 Tax=Tepidamorphus sp. 3E244 TaxID=3385498 RepID=UPI0038FC5DF9